MQKFVTWLDELICSTAWKIEAPKSYGLFHFIYAFGGVLLCVLLARRLSRLGEKGNKRLLFGIGLFLLIAEVYKQLLMYFNFGDRSIVWYAFPFQLCSIPMYFCLIAPFLKEGRLKNAMYCFMSTFNLLGGIAAVIEPSGVFGDCLMLTIHSCIWHMSLIFIGLYLVASGRGVKCIKDYRASVITFLVLCGIAFSLNVIFGEVSDWSINMFFVGPSRTTLVVFSTIYDKFGWVVSTALYIPVVCLGAYVIYLLIRLYQKKRDGQLGGKGKRRAVKVQSCL